jgi:hypothetical protein
MTAQTMPVLTANGEAATDDELAHAVVLVIEGIASDSQFAALTGRPVSDITGLLADATMLARIQRRSLELQNSGALARLEALRHTRSAVQVAASILDDADIYPGQRLAAAEQIHRVAGTSKLAAGRDSPQETVKIVINVPGESAPLVIEALARETD